MGKIETSKVRDVIMIRVYMMITLVFHALTEKEHGRYQKVTLSLKSLFIQ